MELTFPPHFHSTHDAIYISYRHPDTGALTLRCYLVAPGGVLEEFDYTKGWVGERTESTDGDD